MTRAGGPGQDRGVGPAGTVPHLLAFKGPLRPPCLANFSVASVLPNSPSLGNSQGQNYTSSFLEVKVYKVKFLQEVKVKVTQSCPTLCDLYSPWDSPGQNTGVGNLSLLHGIFLTEGYEPRSPGLQVDSLPAEPQGKPKNTGVGSLSLLQ